VGIGGKEMKRTCREISLQHRLHFRPNIPIKNYENSVVCIQLRYALNYEFYNDKKNCALKEKLVCCEHKDWQNKKYEFVWVWLYCFIFMQDVQFGNVCNYLLDFEKSCVEC